MSEETQRPEERIATYEITWSKEWSARVETIRGLLVSYAASGRTEFRGPDEDGRWVLLLSIRNDDVRSIRLVTDGEAIPS